MVENIKDDYDTWANQYDIDANPTRDLDKVATIESLSKIDFSKRIGDRLRNRENIG